MTVYKGLARGGILSRIDLVQQMTVASPTATATGFTSASRTADRLTVSFDRQGSAVTRLLSTASTYWFIPIPAPWDVTAPWQETLFEVEEVTAPNATFSSYSPVAYVGFARSDAGAGLGAGLTWSGTASRGIKGLWIGSNNLGGSTATAGRSMRLYMPHSFNGSVPRFETGLVHLHGYNLATLASGGANGAATAQASATSDGSDMRFVVGVGPGNGAAASGSSVTLTVRARALLFDKRFDGR